MCFPFFQRAGNIALAMGFELHDSRESATGLSQGTWMLVP
jgi:hypothetical protein